MEYQGEEWKLPKDITFFSGERASAFACTHSSYIILGRVITLSLCLSGD